MNITKTLIRKLSNLDVKKDLKKIRKFQKIINPVNKKAKFENYQIKLNDREINYRLFKKSDERIIVFFHGGGWSIGDVDTYTDECISISSKTNCTVALVNYRLAPENKFPKGLDDCYEITKLLFEQKNHREIILMGDSAGGNLACAVTLKSMEEKNIKISKLILLYPSLQSNYGKDTKYLSVIKNGEDNLLTRKNLEDYMELYVNNLDELSNPLISILNSENISKFPESIILVGDKDPLLDEALEFSQKNKKCKIKIYENTIHGFLSNPFGKKIREIMYTDLNNFLGGENEIKK